MDCHICKEKLNTKLKRDVDTSVCINCRRQDLYISKTRTKKEYKLEDSELDELFSYTVFSNTYGKKQEITLFVKSEVEAYSDNKFGGELQEILEVKKQKREQNKQINEQKKERLRQKRYEEIKNLFNEANIPYTNEQALELYIQHGYKIPKSKLSENISPKNKEDLQNVINNMKNREVRERELTEKLKSRGLKLRADSKICDAYVYGGMNAVDSITEKFNNVDDIVDAMEEMNFFYTKTNYKQFLSKNINKNYNNKYYDRLHHDDIVDISKEEALTEIIQNKPELIIPKCLDNLKKCVINKLNNIKENKIIVVKKKQKS